MSFSRTIEDLKNEGYRITKIRKKIVEILYLSRNPVSAPELIKIIEKNKIHANKTTIYRELLFLKENNLINEIDFGDRKKRFEISSNHHHHIVCIKCKAVKEITKNIDLSNAEDEIKSKKFTVVSHTLEFFGICQNCKIKN